jgi:hypothetical protein
MTELYLSHISLQTTPRSNFRTTVDLELQLEYIGFGRTDHTRRQRQ